MLSKNFALFFSQTFFGHCMFVLEYYCFVVQGRQVLERRRFGKGERCLVARHHCIVAGSAAELSHFSAPNLAESVNGNKIKNSFIA